MEEKTERGSGIDSEFPSLIFMGTPDFAVPSLQKLVVSGAMINLVVTQPDRPKGRGKKLSPPPVKKMAEKLNLPIFQPQRIRELAAIEKLRSLRAECVALVAYGQLLTQEFLDIFPLGTLNVHASLLPRYRGAAPIQRAILSGDIKTGVSIMLLDAGMDTGPVLAQREVEIGQEETSGTLHDKLALVGADLLCETLKKWRAGLIQPRPQDDTLATFAPPVEKGELRLSWNLPANRLVNTIRAFDPWPGAYAIYQGKRLKCFKASLLTWEVGGESGEILGRTAKGLMVMGGDGKALAIGDLQLEGQRKLSADEFLRGHPMPPGSFME
ncbi:MAG: methionyl-tRNA formyltransferase [Desulforhabdus sp.]|jgi:methionyl-tRNA formyltransferase|nr:methionyl-tRNA formyltransferase [Desulforhabdus sp.]